MQKLRSKPANPFENRWSKYGPTVHFIKCSFNPPQPWVDFINCFAHLLHLTLNFHASKKLLKSRAQGAKVGNRGAKLFIKSTPVWFSKKNQLSNPLSLKRYYFAQIITVLYLSIWIDSKPIIYCTGLQNHACREKTKQPWQSKVNRNEVKGSVKRTKEKGQERKKSNSEKFLSFWVMN